MIDIQFYIRITVAIIIAVAIAYGTNLYKEKGFNQERTAYRNTIAETSIEKEALVVKQKEHKAVQSFEKVEEKIDTESNVTRSHTKEKVKDERVTEFTDSF